MSLFRAIFAFGNGLEVATLGLVFLVVPPSCLRRAFVVPSLPEAEERGGQAQGIERLGGFLTRERNGGYEGYRDYWGGRLPPPSFFLAEGPVET